MDRKENEYAIKYFKEEKVHKGWKAAIKYHDLAIKALEKQAVKTPIQSFYNEGDYNWECVNCEETVGEGQDYCHHCGQKLLEWD